MNMVEYEFSEKEWFYAYFLFVFVQNTPLEMLSSTAWVNYELMLLDPQKEMAKFGSLDIILRSQSITQQ